MPIEFNCRFCGAMIRVPDKAKGGAGKCPKCGQRITVPKKSTVKKEEPAPEIPFELPKPAKSKPPLPKPPQTDPDEVVFEEFEEASDSGSMEFGEEVPVPSQSGDFAYGSEPEPELKSTSRRKKMQKTDNTMLAILGVIILASVVLAAFIIVPILISEKVTGELQAATGELLELPPTVVDKARIDLSSDELATLLKKLEQSPATISSTSMQIAISAKPEGLLFSVTPGAAHQFYRVDPATNEPFKKYLDQHQADLNDLRQKEIQNSLTRFVTEYQKILSKKSSQEAISAYRDSLAIPALVKGVGNQVAAHYGRGIYRCIYEDSQGGLFFLLPAGVTEFEIKGREDSNGRAVVPLELKARVTGKIDLPKMPEKTNPAKSDAKSKSKKPAQEAESEDEEMNGNK